MDQANDMYITTMELALEKFKSKNLIIPCPSVMDDFDLDGLIDPCGFDYENLIFDLLWFTKGMCDYNKLKYNVIVTKWFKDTSGGEKIITNFPNYCYVKGTHIHGWYGYMCWMLKRDICSHSQLEKNAPTASFKLNLVSLLC